MFPFLHVMAFVFPWLFFVQVDSVFDLSHFLQVSVAGIPIMFLIIGIVGALKRAGVKGRALFIWSVINGLFWGCGYQIAQLPLPEPGFLPIFVYLFAILAYGAAMGIVASLGYDVGKELVSSVISQAMTGLMANLGSRTTGNLTGKERRQDPSSR